MKKKNIAVVMGGYSSEFEISLQSGAVVFESLDRQLYNVYSIHILNDGWDYMAPDGSKYPLNKANFSFSNGNEFNLSAKYIAAWRVRQRQNLSGKPRIVKSKSQFAAHCSRKAR